MNRHGWCLALHRDGSADFWFHDGGFSLPPHVDSAIADDVAQCSGVEVMPLMSIYGACWPKYQVTVRLGGEVRK